MVRQTVEAGLESWSGKLARSEKSPQEFIKWFEYVKTLKIDVGTLKEMLSQYPNLRGLVEENLTNRHHVRPVRSRCCGR